MLRLTLGLSVKEFAALIGKSISAVTSLETGRLVLSEETAFKIAEETGVSIDWLLEGNAKQKPYVRTSPDRSKEPYKKEYFENVQSWRKHRDRSPNSYAKPQVRLWPALAAIGDWLSVYHKAVETGEADLVRYLMRKFLDSLVERFGKNDQTFMLSNADVRITLANARELVFGRRESDGRIVLRYSPEEQQRISSEIAAIPPAVKKRTS